jgi:predicted nucleotidyltransferase component of viral defense system
MMLDAANHKNILIRILKDIYTDATIGPLLGFKGGTAVYLFYDLNRFSVDLDFDLLDPSQEEYVFTRIKKIIEEYGTIKESFKKRYTLFLRLSYVDNHQNIKVEINLRNFGSQYEVKSYLGISMKVMVKQDMAANKMVAMIERIGKANRDIFDTYFFLKNSWPINEQIIEKRTGLSMHQFLKKCINALESMSNIGILSGLGDLLDAKLKAWVKTKLLTETIFLLQLKLENLPKPPEASVYSYKEGANTFDPSAIGSRSYKEYKSGGIYNMPILPATAIIHFDIQVNEHFLNKFIRALEERTHQYIKENGLDKKDITRQLHDLKIVKKRQSLQLSTYLSKEELEELITATNNIID